MKNTVNTTGAFLIIIAVSVLVGFYLTREETPLSDTTEYGIKALDQLDNLEQELDKEAQ